MSSVVHSDLMLCDISGAKRLFPPFHFDQVNFAIDFHYTVNLLDNPLAVFATDCECFSNQDAAFFEKTVEHRLKCFSPSLRIGADYESSKVGANLAYCLLPFFLLGGLLS